MRDNMYNVDMKRCQKRLEKNTIFGKKMENITRLIVSLVYSKKGIDVDNLNHEELDEFIKSSMPRDYEDMKAQFEEFKSEVQKIAEEHGCKVIHKDELKKYPGMYSISLKDALEGKEPRKNPLDNDKDGVKDKK